MPRGISNKKLNELKELNKKLSAKKSRIKKTYGVEADVSRIDTTLRGKALKKAVQEVNAFLNPNANKFTVTNRDGVKFSFGEIKKARSMTQKAEKKRKASLDILKNQPYTIDGKVQSESAYEIALRRTRNFHEKFEIKFNPDSFRSRTAFEKWFEGREQSYKGDFVKRRRHQYRANYFTALREVFGDTSDVDQLIGKIQELSIDDFYLQSLTSDERHIEYVYDGDKRDAILQEIGEAWGIDLGLMGV